MEDTRLKVPKWGEKDFEMWLGVIEHFEYVLSKNDGKLYYADRSTNYRDRPIKSLADIKTPPFCRIQWTVTPLNEMMFFTFYDVNNQPAGFITWKNNTENDIVGLEI